MDMASDDVSAETLKMMQIVVKLVQSLFNFNLRYALWMDS
jgi:hypothetical protein